jgi:hypothetical protein
MMWRRLRTFLYPQDLFRLLPAVAAAILALSLMTWPVSAQTPDREEAFVWATTVFSGVKYESTFYPPEADTLYLLAGHDHVIAPRQTLIYYWPITNRILADWLAKNDVVEGQLVIQNSRGDTQTLDITDYVIQFNSDAPDLTLALYAGEKAHTQYAQFDEARREFANALHANYQLQLEYQNALTAAAQAATKGETVETPEEPPQLPPFNWYSTDIKRAFVVNLPAGDYEIYLRLPDGREQPSSRKKLRVFAPRRQGVGYTIVPQAKWTVPEESNDPQNVIYALPDVTLYLQPFQEFEANQLEYARFIDAQTEGVRGDRFTWVHTYPYSDARLQLLKDGKVIEEVPQQDYFVRQLPGASLGYEVELYDPESDRSPSFSGYAIHVNEGLSRYQVRLVDENGQPVPGSVREIRLLSQPDQRILLGLSMLPLLMGLGVVFWRRSQLERIEHQAG